MEEKEKETTGHYICPDFSSLSDDEEFLFSKCQLQQQHEERISDFGLLDDTRFNVASPSLEKCLEEIAKLGENDAPTTLIPHIDNKDLFPKEIASLKLLNGYSKGLRRLNLEPRDETICGVIERKRLSTDEVLRVAGARFIQSASLAVGDITCTPSNPLNPSFSALSTEETRDIELVELLLACAEKVGYGQFERARKLLGQCGQLCSKTGNPIERVVYYFCEALREKINDKKSEETIKEKAFDPDEAMIRLNATSHAFHEAVPFSQLALFAGVQAIAERVGDSKRVHVVDLRIRSGVQWTVLMQALASSPSNNNLKLLKISALGTSFAQRDAIEETGERLSSFAQTLGIPFSFKVVLVSDMSQLREELFELDSGETVVVYASFVLRTMLFDPCQLESLLRVVTSLNPRVMVITEVEANHNSRDFVTRFVEALFFFGAYFDCLESFMGRDDENRMVSESKYFRSGIVNMVASEGIERKIRNVAVGVWRVFFARFGLVETELSSSSLYQVKLLLKKFSCEEFCTVDLDRKCLIYRWKGTPIQSLSVWEFLEFAN